MKHSRLSHSSLPRICKLLVLLAVAATWTFTASAQDATAPAPPDASTSTTTTTTTATPAATQPPAVANSAPPSATTLATTSGTRVGSRMLFMMIGIAVTFLLYYLFSGLHPFLLILGQDNRYSNSKFQVAMWFFVMIASYVATFASRLHTGWVGGINIPENLLILSGMSAFTYGAAKGITMGKINEAKAQGNDNPKNVNLDTDPSLLHDLTHSDIPHTVVDPNQAGPTSTTTSTTTPFVAVQQDSLTVGQVTVDKTVLDASPQRRKRIALPNLDLGDVQMLIVSLLAVGTYVISVFYFLGGADIGKAVTTLPNVDNSILTIFGLGHGAYLTKKAVGTVGQS
ncbi:MAG: hypothetical protein ABI197_03500 [Granulicella sp.]